MLVLEELDISEGQYESALKISDDEDFQLHMKRLTDLHLINNYFYVGPLTWEANIDMQLAFEYYKAITYLFSYLSKEEDECSLAMKQAFNKTLEKAASWYEQMKSVAYAYSSKRELAATSCKTHYARTIA